jgi:hypothetical protein
MDAMASIYLLFLLTKDMKIFARLRPRDTKGECNSVCNVKAMVMVNDGTQLACVLIHIAQGT